MQERKNYKNQIYLARTYRHLRVNKKKSILFLVLVLLPTLVGMLLGYGKVSEWMAQIVTSVFQVVEPHLEISYEWHTFIPGLASLKIVAMETTYPDVKFILINIFIAFLLIVVGRISKKKMNPFSIYITMMMFVHLINSIFFLFVKNAFPYTATDYSELYMKQQLGIWICFIVLVGLVVGILGSGKMYLKVATFLGIMSYSFIFGILRYVVFLFIIYKCSMIYMALFFFALGPFFDFLYLVAIYGIYIDKVITVFSEGKEREEWIWS